MYVAILKPQENNHINNHAGLVVMDSACLPFCLTEDERRHVHEQGYLVVPDALDRAMLDRLTAAVDRVDARERTGSFGRDRLLSFANILAEFAFSD